MQKERKITFDIMKGIGIILMITSHFFSWNHPVLRSVITSFHMPMFFIVAGFFTRSYSNMAASKEAFVRFFKRLIIPFVFVQVLWIGWDLIMHFSKGAPLNTMVSNFLSIFWADVHGPIYSWCRFSIGSTWFLVALFWAKYLMIPLSRLGHWAIPISLVVAYGAVLLFRFFPYSIWSLSSGLTALPFVAIGWWCKENKEKIAKFRYKSAIVLLLISSWVVAMILGNMDMYSCSWSCYPLNVLGACGGTLCLYLLCILVTRYTSLLAKVCAWLGVCSLAILCAHNFETYSHLTNHLQALLPFCVSEGFHYVLQYAVTISLAVLFIKAPIVRRVFNPK